MPWVKTIPTEPLKDVWQNTENKYPVIWATKVNDQLYFCQQYHKHIIFATAFSRVPYEEADLIDQLNNHKLTVQSQKWKRLLDPLLVL